MNWLDIVIMLFLILSIFLGFKAGIIKTLVPLIGLIIGVTLALRFYVAFGRVLSFIPQPNVAKGVAFAIILIVAVLIFAGLARLLALLVEKVMLGWVDHVLGALFGLFFGAFFVAFVVAIWVVVFGEAGPISQSRFASFLMGSLPSVLGLLPGELDSIRSFFH
jgi:membrane protein required for colicin V production